MATRAVLTPYAAEFPSTNYPQLTLSNATARRPVLAYDASTKETAYWTIIAPQGLTGAITCVISYAMASATSGGIAWSVAIEAITTGDATDTDATTSFAADNTATDSAVPGTAGYMEQVSVSVSTDDSMIAADYVRVSIAREVANGTDTATGDMLLLAAELRDAA
jgi:hypothetical protein